MAFQPGDVVKLKSGGEKMTVESVGEDGLVECVWFEDKKVVRGSFEPVTLKEFGTGGSVAFGRSF